MPRFRRRRETALILDDLKEIAALFRLAKGD